MVKLAKAEQELVERLLFKIMEEARGKKLGLESYICLALVELLIFIARKATCARPVDSVPVNHMHAKISEIIKYLNIRYMKKISLEGIAEIFYISPYHLSKVFKKKTGFSFTEYLNSLRIREAQQLLKESHLSVSEIADKVGYESQTHFGRVFKKITGMSPLQLGKID